ncbi:MAG: helix-turn-helix domain-containing protein [Vicingaceae bacterium]|nr:helix-turn-helix domain-containing protein [Vicingaceae bacterium]
MLLNARLLIYPNRYLQAYRTYIASIEQGKRNVSIVNIEKIAKALDMSVYQFFNSDLFK